ncbi:MAG: alpha/beta hydrolase [Bdellovibrio sp.]
MQVRSMIVLDLLVAVLAWAGVAHADPSAKDLTLCGKNEFFFSKVLPRENDEARKVKYRVLLPKNFNSSYKYSVVYYLHGRDSDRWALEGLGVCESMNALIDSGKTPFIIIAPDGGTTYWMNAAGKNERWGDVITHELVGDVDSKYPTIASPEGRLLSGISMGGHGTFQLNLNFPGIFGALAAHSPAFRTEKEALKEFPLQFGAGQDFKDRDPFSLMQEAGKRLHIPIWMDIGAKDDWFKNTKRMAEYLKEIGYTGELHIGEDFDGAHELSYWKKHLPEYLDWYSKHLRSPVKE